MSKHKTGRELYVDMAEKAHARGNHNQGATWDRKRDALDQQEAEKNAQKGGAR